MSALRKSLRVFVKDESGATVVEYLIITAGISILIVTVVQGLGEKLNSTFSNIDKQLNPPAVTQPAGKN